MGELQPANPNVKYRTHRFYEFVIDGVDVDVMEGFAIVKDGVEYDCSFTEKSIRQYEKVDGQ